MIVKICHLYIVLKIYLSEISSTLFDFVKIIQKKTSVARLVRTNSGGFSGPREGVEGERVKCHAY